MFLDLPNPWPPQDPPPAEPPRKRLSPRQEKVLLWAIGLNLAALVVAPIGGFTVIDGLIALFAR